MGHSDRDLIFICFGRKDITPQLNFKEIFEDNLTAANLSQQGKLQVKFFVDEQIVPGSNWEAEIRAAIDKTRVAVILEGPGLFTSEFVQREEIPRFLEVAQKASGLQVFRIPIRPAASRLVPSGLKRLQSAHPIEQPLSDMSKAKRDSAIGRIIDKLIEAYEGDITATSKDELQDPPFEISQANKTLQIFPDRILQWLQDVDFERQFNRIHPTLIGDLNDRAREVPVSPISLTWRLHRPSEGVLKLFGNRYFSSAWLDELKTSLALESPEAITLSNWLDAAKRKLTLEGIAARAYPRFRDAQLALYMCGDTSPREKQDNFKHAKSVMLSLFRKHEDLWLSVEKLSRDVKGINLGDEEVSAIQEFTATCRFIPYCELGVLQRLFTACESVDPLSHSNSIEYCYQLLDRICHWLQMTNRVMNNVIDMQFEERRHMEASHG